MRSLLVWLLPFFVSGSMGLGALIGLSFFGGGTSQPGTAGDLAGAAGALLLLICTVMGFVMALLTVLVAKVLRSHDYNHFALRIVCSFVGGTIISVLGSVDGKTAIFIAWLLLFTLPVLCAWPGRILFSMRSSPGA